MAIPPYTRATERFQCNGIDLNSPVDAIRPGYYPIIENVRSYTDGVIQPRQGVVLITTDTGGMFVGQTPVHSIRRLNDPTSTGFIRVFGAGTQVAFSTSTAATIITTTATYNGVAIATSGNPLSMVPYRPDQAVSSWMYMADSSVMRKIVGQNVQGITPGTVHQIGLPPPANPPTIELYNWAFSNVFAASSSGTAPYNWVADGAVLSTGISITNRVSTGNTITAAKYAAGAGNFASIVVPQAVADVTGVGMAMYSTDAIFTTNQMIVHEVYRASSTGLTVSAVSYDTGATGDCIVQPSQSVSEIQRNAIVQFNSSQYSRITDVIFGPDGSRTFRCNTTGTITSTQSLQVMPTCFVLYTGAPLAGQTLSDQSTGTAGVVQTTGAGTSSAKTGWMQITTSTPMDLSQFTSGAGLPAYQDDDLFHTSVLLSDLSQLSQGRILLDVDTTSLSISSVTTSTSTAQLIVTTSLVHNLSSGDTVFVSGTTGVDGTYTIFTSTSASTFEITTNSTLVGAALGTAKPQFKKNFYYRAFTANDLIPVTKATQTALAGQQNVLGNQVVDIPLKLAPGYRTSPPIFRGGGRNESGDTPDITDRVRERNPNIPDDPNATTPSGTSRSQSGSGDYQWSELRFRKSDFQRVGQGSQTLAKTNAMRVEFTLTSTAAVTVGVNSNLLYGGHALDTSDLGIPYIYRYRYRSSATGAVSNWSPASRSGLVCLRDQATVRISSTSTAPEVTHIDVQRLGGTNTTWLIVGSSTSTVLNDSVSDLAATAAAPFSDLDTNFQLWPTTAKPATGTTASVVGPYVNDSGTTFNVSWAKGTPIRVNGIDTTIRRVISTSRMEVEDSLGSLGAVTWEIPAPELIGQPLPALWEWNNRGFACGDPNNPGWLYYSNGNSLDTTQDTFTLEVTPPSEPLQNGCSYNGKNYVWSSERMFEIDQIGPDQFFAIEIPGHKGMFSRWGLAVGEKIWWIARDGIYQSGGGDSISITDETLRPFFVTEGNAGVAVNGFNPPDLTVPNRLRLSYYDGYLYFIYKDTGGSVRTLVYTPRAKSPGWWPDTYLDGQGLAYIYGEEGSGVHSLLAGGNEATARLYQITGSSDNGAVISGHVRTRAFDGGDRRANKYWGDLIIDTDSTGTFTPVFGLNNHVSTVALNPTVTIASTAAGARVQTVFDVGSSGTITEARNADVDITWTSTGTPKLFLWEPAYITMPENSNLRPTYWDDLGYRGDKFVQGIEISTDTNNVARTVLVEYDGGTLADTLTIQHNGYQTKAYAFHPAFTAHSVRLRPTDTNTWQTFEYRWLWQPEAPLVDHWETQQTNFGSDQFVHMKEAFICLKSTMNVTFTITRTDDATATSYIIPTSSGNKMKIRVPFTAPVSKGKAFSFVFSSTSTGGQFRLYADESAILVKDWASEQGYKSKNVWQIKYGSGTPFGGPTGNGAAAI